MTDNGSIEQSRTLVCYVSRTMTDGLNIEKFRTVISRTGTDGGRIEQYRTSTVCIVSRTVTNGGHMEQLSRAIYSPYIVLAHQARDDLYIHISRLLPTPH